MSLSRFRILNEQDLTEVLQALSNCQFIDGKLSARGRAKAAKAHTQVIRDDVENTKLDIVEKKLLESALLQVLSVPKLIGGMLVNSYKQGQTYVWHVAGVPDARIADWRSRDVYPDLIDGFCFWVVT